MEEDGLYLHKRHIRGEHGKMLEQAGTVLLHTLVYLKAGEQARSYLVFPCCHDLAQAHRNSHSNYPGLRL